eukprot:TRINITY_DN44075_c0_g1_i1.p1 TRINITY_DN44075_c0_g1~~TRINITY_DN44075_c0_g1_i1.p1  ORF type:complete len:121 (+),score=10.91 TRINITY_DN44075_c0_g1_i1:384-746(+)
MFQDIALSLTDLAIHCCVVLASCCRTLHPSSCDCTLPHHLPAKCSGHKFEVCHRLRLTKPCNEARLIKVFVLGREEGSESASVCFCVFLIRSHMLGIDECQMLTIEAGQQGPPVMLKLTG